jgi:hypothetical protein
MARPVKLTKFSVENALARTGSVSRAAEYAGVGRRTFQRAMQRFGLGFGAVSDRFGSLYESASTHASETAQDVAPVEAPTKPVELKSKSEKTLPRLIAADFSGTFRGDAGRENFATSLDNQSARYRRLKGY